MNPEFNFILMTVMITCVAFVGATNSKGTSKMVVSYILAFVCLAVTAFSVSQYLVATSKKRASEIAGETGKIIGEKL